ncbi:MULTISPECIES: hypothetical protein [unclassified Thioalkalivibrio]|uniref:hypothetical protein n=1 Tax=unclassified Thioalkalivibrio TaxID=2621013 RepID=UPI0003631957|nr:MULTISPECIES: hypothetical protein [unclassified Thioalkalivibrio]
MNKAAESQCIRIEEPTLSETLRNSLNQLLALFLCIWAGFYFYDQYFPKEISDEHYEKVAQMVDAQPELNGCPARTGAHRVRPRPNAGRAPKADALEKSPVPPA